jgi:YidC/Oxa1 family membrane protein insertase
MERRVFVAILLSFVVLYAYQALFVPPPPRPTSSPAATDPEIEAAAVSRARPPAEPEGPVPVDPEGEALVLTSEPEEREITVETARADIVFTNRGARVLRWRLKDYLDPDGSAVDLVPTGVPAGQPGPFSLLFDDEELTRRVSDALFLVNGDLQGRLNATASKGELGFEFEDASGLRVRKSFTFEPSSYVVGVVIEASSATGALNPAIEWGPGLGDTGAISGGGSFLTANYSQPPQGIYHRDGEVDRFAADQLRADPLHEGRFRFAGVDDHYFIATAIEPGEARVTYHPLTLPSADGTERQLLAHSIQRLESRGELRFYVGPKLFDALQPVDPELTKAINFGIFGVLAVPLLKALNWVHGFVGNYGWSIVVLTVLINLLIAPLRHKSVVSMRKMQALQPQLKAIQDHYAGLKVTDPARQKMNSEIMGLYREKGVNPASGCVPMLMTFPILFAFYSLLSQAIELRGAEFGWWITDLSEHDPYYVTPLLMAATMFWQQRITPSTADPTQQKIMMMMPFMFGVMFLWVPSGLVLYWFVGNLWAIGQQYFTNWMIGPVAAATVRSAEGRTKKVGSGRTTGAEGKS